MRALNSSALVVLALVGCASSPPRPAPATAVTATATASPGAPEGSVATPVAPADPQNQAAPPVSGIVRNTSAISTIGEPGSASPHVGSGSTSDSESRVTALHTAGTDNGGVSSPVRSAVATSPRETLATREEAMRQCIRAVHARTLTLRIAIARSGTVTGIEPEADAVAMRAVPCVTTLVRAAPFEPQPRDTTLSLTLIAR